jgi:multidrug efflux pump subunit AcrA (membrane-fusion protein)
MSDVRPDIDLSALARAPAAAVAPPKRRKLRIVVPLLLLVGFAAVLASTLGDFFTGAVAVTVVRPQAAEGVAAAGGATLQRSGWIEPDPFPIHATALVPGIVKQVLVLEAATVHPGDSLATLVDDAARLDVAAAQAALARASAELAKAQVERSNAHESFDAALEIDEQLATAVAEEKARAAEAAKRDAAAAEAAARVRVATEELSVQRYLAEHGGAGPRQVELSEAKVDLEHASLAQMQADAALAHADAEKAAARLVRARRERELRLPEKLRVQTADAASALAEAVVAESKAAADRAALALERTVVRVPGAGDASMPQTLVVEQRLAAPGSSVGGEGRESVATLYDPDHLRVRVDVEQSEVRKLALGQHARIAAPTRPGKPYDGEVTRIVAQANVEKVTLQVHVKIAQPDAALRPEMLVEVAFQASEAAAGPAGATGATSETPASHAVWIPARLIEEGSVWIVDAASGRAARRAVEVAQRDGERVLVTRGLDLSDKVIDGGRQGLAVGRRLTISGDGSNGGGR